jgi:DNA-binding transcriptional regulator YiaG
MTPKEFKAARNDLGFSAAGLAETWKMGANGGRTIRRWESGSVPVNPIAAHCIALMQAAAAVAA